MKIKLLILCLFLSVCSWAQEKNDTLLLLTDYSVKQGVRLKWLPISYKLFLSGFDKGYNVYRADVIKNSNGSEKLGDFKKLNTSPIIRYTTEQLKKAYEKDSTIAGAAAFVDGAEELLNQATPTTISGAVEQEKAHRFLTLIANFSVVVSNPISEALGMFYRDSTAKASTKYVYRLEVIGSKEMFNQLVITKPNQEKSKVLGLDARLYPESINLTWFRSEKFPYYNIYRSLSKTKGFVKLNTIPFVGDMGNAKMNENRVSFLDSIPEYNKTFYYKIIGVDAFENEGIPSDVVEIRATYLLKNSPQFSLSESKDNKTVDLAWTYPDEEILHVKKFDVYHATSARGEYKKVNQADISNKKLTYTDTRSLGSSNYYSVCAYGAAGDSMCSIFRMVLLVDSIPPAVPKIVFGKCDSSGVVTMYWEKNKEPDMLGYRIFKTFNLNVEPNRAIGGHTPDTSFVDTINIKEGNRSIFYRIAAIDDHFNPSVPSAFFEIPIPDFIPPTNGYMKTYAAGMTGIRLTWNPSNASDLKTMHLMRKSNFDLDYQILKSFSGDSLRITTYTDTATKSNVDYAYCVQAEDEAGLKSDLSNVFVVTQINKKKFISVTNVSAFVSRENKMVKLVWEYPQYAKGFKIYRAQGKKPMETYQFVKGDQREFYDKWLTPNTNYSYLIIAELDGGFESGYSEEVKVKY